MKILLLAGNTLRAKAYAQTLAASNIKNLEVKGLFYGSFTELNLQTELNLETKSYFIDNNIFIPDFNKSLIDTFDENNWNFSMVNNRDVNSMEVLNKICELDCELVVFAGYGGQLLSKDHFSTSRKYLHMHPGKLPEERGSTTIYYSILNKRKCTVTAFYMTDKIDDGKNIIYKQYNVPFKNVDIDRWFDNTVRADCFIEALRNIQLNNNTTNLNYDNSHEYYVIHPVLKHCAILSLKEKDKNY